MTIPKIRVVDETVTLEVTMPKSTMTKIAGALYRTRLLMEAGNDDIEKVSLLIALFTQATEDLS